MTTRDDIEIPKTGVFGGKLAYPVRLIREPSVFDAMTGGGVVLLAILGLAGVAPQTMVALSCIAVGLAVAVEGVGVARRYHRMVSSHGRSENSEVRAAIIVQAVGGAVGLVLGLLTLAGIGPFGLLAVASVVFGASLLLGTGAEVEVGAVTTYYEPSDTRRMIHHAEVAAGGARLLVAVSAVVLGVLAFAGVETVTLLLTASLALGIALLLGSVSVGDRLRPPAYSENPTA